MLLSVTWSENRQAGHDRLAAHAGADHLFLVISLRTSTSRSRSATIFFRRPFSCLGWRKRLTSDGSKLPQGFRQL